MKRTLILTAFLGMISLGISAQTKKEKIIELFQLMKTDKMMSAMIDNMSMMQTKALTFESAYKDSVIKAFIKEENLTLFNKILNTDMLDVYDKYFTIIEIQKYIDFYKTSEGQKMIDVMPSLQKDLMTTMTYKYMPEMQARMKKKFEEFKDK